MVCANIHYINAKRLRDKATSKWDLYLDYNKCSTGNGERLQAFAIFDDTNHTKDEVKKEENQENR